jgi:L-ascorbate metabolism protein UlaG (beta-lactamase superfamily)
MADPAPLSLQPRSTEPAPAESGSLYFIGNATVLLRLGGFTVLTDPSFIHKHEQTWLGYGLHTERLTDPACGIADLPPLDFVLLSHFHGDHFDQAAEDGLDRALPIVTTPQSAELLAGRGFANTWPVDRWQTQVVTKGRAELRITATPGHHGPPLVDVRAAGRDGLAARVQPDRRPAELPALHHRRHPADRRPGGDPPPVPGDRPGAAPSGRHPGPRHPRFDGR